jgi:O-methyltransferase involved in polyketide biosynthesis
MQFGKPSQTALATAFHRAAHQVLEQGRIFADPLALRILGADAPTIARQAGENPSGRRLRATTACRCKRDRL